MKSANLFSQNFYKLEVGMMNNNNFKKAFQESIDNVNPVDPPSESIKKLEEISNKYNLNMESFNKLVDKYIDYFNIDPDSPPPIAILRSGYQILAYPDLTKIIDELTNAIIGESFEMKNEKIETWENFFEKANEFRINEIEYIIENMNENTIKDLFGHLLYKEIYKKQDEIIEEVFNVDLDKPPVIFVEGKTDEVYLNKAKEILDRKEVDIEIEWIGRMNNQKNVEFTGKSALDRTKSFILANQNVLNQKVILLYDSDANKKEKNYNNLFIKSVPKNPDNKLFNKGIENLLTLPKDFNKEKFYEEKIKEKNIDYGGSKIVKIKKLNKTKLCDWICFELSPNKQEKYFEKFNMIFNDIEEILQWEIDSE